MQARGIERGVARAASQFVERRRPLLLLVLAALTLVAWAFASPIGSSPDDDYHLTSSWCAGPAAGELCEPGEVADERVVPEALTDIACYAYDPQESAACQGEAFDWYPFRRDGQRFPLPDARERALTEIFITATDGSGESRQLTRLRLRPGNVRWRPNSSELLFTADEAVLDELAYSRSDLFVVTVEGELTRLTNDGYTYSGADFSPDGRWISYTRAFGTNMIIDRKLNHGGPRDLYVRPTDGGEPLNLTENWDLDPGSPMWSPDSQHIYFVAGIGGTRHLFRAAPDGGGVEQITTGHRRINGLDINESFQRMTYTVGEFERPSDIYVADIDGGNEYRLTNIHADFFAEVEGASRPSEQILYMSYDGTPVEGSLLYPFRYDPQGQYPLIVVNHGGPHSASGYGFNFKNMLFAANGYFVFLPNFRSSTGYGDTFKWGTWGAWGTNDGEDVLAGVDHLIARYSIDRNRVGSTGHSYGGILTNWLITRYPDRFKAAVSGAEFAQTELPRPNEKPPDSECTSFVYTRIVSFGAMV